jgi:predicted nucleic acid-binding protein
MTTPIDGFMLDTNVFNHVLDGRMDVNALQAGNLYVTHIQNDEIANTRDPVRRDQLQAIVTRVLSTSPAPAAGREPGVMPTESAVWGVSKWGEAKWTAPDALLDKMLAALNSRNKGKKNNVQDVLIAETALLNQLALVTADADLAEVMKMFGGTVVTP